MRRASSILAIVALLATPLALLARSGISQQSQCSRMCCMIQRGVHSANAKPRRCICGVPAQKLQCAMKPLPRTPDYGLNAPVVPTAPASLVTLAVPKAGRLMLVALVEFPASGFSSVPFEPPRS
jgi:hypothetical protein